MGFLVLTLLFQLAFTEWRKAAVWCSGVVVLCEVTYLTWEPQGTKAAGR